ncbi:serine/threonine-protein kinase Genghis Khan isoform X2 [Cherax quadricarinatus]|uniref:serine/threonine-protein kinase Genghis Khan isoform X2 n=1 Tax=Cherax quadricarinatus TaxID=27406 RepID=UPI00387EA43C
MSEADVKLKEMDRLLKAVMQEKENSSREIADLQEKLTLQTKELQDALTQRKLAMSEYSEVSDKLTELRNQKQKLSRQVRDKEEELETAMQKIDTLRQDLRRAEKLRRELEGRSEEAEAEASKERKLRERSEEYTRNIEGELEKMQQRPQGRSPSLNSIEASQEVTRLKSDLERVCVDQEERAQQQALRHSHEMSAIRDQLAEAESTKSALQNEVTVLTKKVEQLRSELEKRSEEQEDSVMDVKRRHDREKAMLLDDNKKLLGDVERLTESLNRMQNERRSLEEEYEDLRSKKESIAQWEAQITEIIQWVSDEKDARGYLQALATRMTEELETLKVSGVVGGGSSVLAPPEKNWRNRRSQKLDKMELLNLQSSLNSEIQAKQVISEELSKVRADLVAAQKDVREFKQRYENISRENMRKEKQVRDLQSRLEAGEGLLERPASQMSFLEQFLKETSLRRGGSLESEEGDVEDEGAPSVPSLTSSRSFISQEQLGSPHMESRPLPPLPQTATNVPPGVMPTMAHHQHSSVAMGMSGGSSSSGGGPSPHMMKQKAHQFLVRSFSNPIKCSHCTSLMVGLTRQGVVCEVCGFACHTTCKEKVPQICPVPPDQTKRPLGIDPTRGIGTAYEGFVKVPKPGGVKKGWSRQFVVVCDFKLFLYDISPERNALPSVWVSTVLDMRDDQFEVSTVRDSDVIHANKKDIPCIFRVSIPYFRGGQPFAFHAPDFSRSSSDAPYDTCTPIRFFKSMLI